MGMEADDDRLRGRPKKDGGHTPVKLSLDQKTMGGLAKIKGPKSAFIEDILRPIVNQFDPGDACHTLERVDKMLSDEITTATNNKEYDRVMALSYFGERLSEIRQLCSEDPRGDEHTPISSIRETLQPDDESVHREIDEALAGLKKAVQRAMDTCQPCGRKEET